MLENNNFDNTPDVNSERTEETGNISGFDTVDNQEQGYTVTPQGGFYTRSGEDIIQDEPIVTDSSNEAGAETVTDNTDGQSRGYFEPEYNFNMFSINRNDKPKRERRRFSAATVVVSVLLSAIVGLGGGIAAVKLYGNQNSSSSGGISIPSKNINITVDEKSVASVAQAVAEKAGDSVVGIRTTTSVVNFFGGVSETPGEGSGVIYSSDGYIITNYHVIEGAVEAGGNSKIEVFLNGDKETPHQATVIGYHISSDLAVIKINAKGLKAVEIGSADKLAVGQYVVTIGSPGGLEFMGSVTYGIISGLDRVVSSNSSVELIQTDAAINPGNSGGALLNTAGELIGINSSKIVSEEYEGMGFAIPIDTVTEKVDKIISRQNQPEPYFGVSISERYTSSVLSYYGFPSGAVVLSVDDGSPAAKAGIQKGDIITEFNGKKIKEYQMLGEYINDCDPNQKVDVKLYRSGRYYTVGITIGANS